MSKVIMMLIENRVELLCSDQSAKRWTPWTPWTRLLFSVVYEGRDEAGALDTLDRGDSRLPAER